MPQGVPVRVRFWAQKWGCTVLKSAAHPLLFYLSYGAQNEAYRIERDKKTTKDVYLQQVAELRLWMRHKTKRLHRLTFGLHLSEFCLHPWHGMFTQYGLHVCACGSFRLLSYNCLSVGVLRVCVAFPCQYVGWRVYGIGMAVRHDVSGSDNKLKK